MACSSNTEFQIYRTKIALAVVIVRLRPLGSTGADHTRTLAASLLNKRLGLKDSLQALTLEVIKLQQGNLPHINIPPAVRTSLNDGTSNLRLALNTLNAPEPIWTNITDACLAVLSAPWPLLCRYPWALQRVAELFPSLPDPKPLIQRCLALADWTVDSIMRADDENTAIYANALRALMTRSVVGKECAFFLSEQFERHCVAFQKQPILSLLESKVTNGLYYILKALEFYSAVEADDNLRNRLAQQLERSVRRVNNKMPLLSLFVWHITDRLRYTSLTEDVTDKQ